MDGVNSFQGMTSELWRSSVLWRFFDEDIFKKEPEIKTVFFKELHGMFSTIKN